MSPQDALRNPGAHTFWGRVKTQPDFFLGIILIGILMVILVPLAPMLVDSLHADHLFGEQFDLVTSSISLHHVEDKGALFRRVRESIKSGGTFRFIDQLSGGTEANHARMWNSLMEFMGSPGNCTHVELQSMVDHSKAHDHYTPLAAHFHLLQEAGFVGIDCVWRDLMWSVITADVT